MITTVGDNGLTRLCSEIINSSETDISIRIRESKERDIKHRFDSELKRTKEYISSLSKSDQEKFIKKLMK